LRRQDKGQGDQVNHNPKRIRHLQSQSPNSPASIAAVPPNLVHLPEARPPDWVGITHRRPFICEIVPDEGVASRAIPHVSNIEYLRWVDRIAELHAKHLGLSRESLLAIDRMWFVARHELDYAAETWPGERIHVATWVRSVGRTRSWRETMAWRESDQRVVLRAATCWVLVDILSRRPSRIDPSWSTQLDPLLDEDPSATNAPTAARSDPAGPAV